MYIDKFEENEIPYKKLENIGFSKESIESLPEDVFKNLLAGETTPVLTSETEFDGEHTKCRIRLIRDNEGEADAIFMRFAKSMNLGIFSEEEKQSLLKGDVVNKNSSYYQFDDKTNQVLAAPANIINSNLTFAEKDLEDIKAEDVAKGEVVEGYNNGGRISVGIDLTTPTGIRFANGDRRQWNEEKQGILREEYNFGLFGCWIADRNNTLSYVPEDQYDEKINKALEYQADNNRQQAMHRGR